MSYDPTSALAVPPPTFVKQPGRSVPWFKIVWAVWILVVTISVVARDVQPAYLALGFFMAYAFDRLSN